MAKKVKLEDDDIIIHKPENEQAYHNWIEVINFLECLYLEDTLEKATYSRMMETMINLKQNCRL